MAKPTTIELIDVTGADEDILREALRDKVLLFGGKRVINWIDDLTHILESSNLQGGPRYLYYNVDERELSAICFVDAGDNPFVQVYALKARDEGRWILKRELPRAREISLQVPDNRIDLTAMHMEGLFERDSPNSASQRAKLS